MVAQIFNIFFAQKEIIDDVRNGPYNQLSTFFTTNEGTDSLDLLKFYLKRRYESDLGTLLNDLLRLLQFDLLNADDKLYAKLSSATATAISAVRADFDRLMPKSAPASPLLISYQHAWQVIQKTISTGRSRMIEILLDHGIFVPIDLQPTISSNFFDRIYHLVRFARAKLWSERIEKIAHSIRNAMTSKSGVFDTNAQAKVEKYLMTIEATWKRQENKGEADYLASVANVDYYIRHEDNENDWRWSIIRLRAVCTHI